MVGIDEHRSRRPWQLELRTAALDSRWTGVSRRHVVACAAHPRRTRRHKVPSTARESSHGAALYWIRLIVIAALVVFIVVRKRKRGG